MKKISLLTLMAIFFFAACKKDHITGNHSGNKKMDTLQGAITASMTLDPSKNYYLKGQVYVKNNATLTIPAGITVFAQVNEARSAKSALIITQGSMININGTAAQPVVFTSASSTPQPGDWGALVILGKAPTNSASGNNAAGLPVTSDTQYGGNVAADNSGSITYLRLEYTGGLNPPAENEWSVDKVSGLALLSVGSGTTVDHVMVKYSNDDSFQWVGGTVNATHLISYNAGDDDFDFDMGYEGNLQFLVGYRTHASSQALRANGVESYNDSVPTTNTPLTRPVISNMTIIGPEGTDATVTNSWMGVYMRKGTRLAIRNSLDAEFSKGAFMDCPRTRPVILADDDAEFRHNLVETDTVDRTFAWDQGQIIAVPDPDMTTFMTNSVNQDSVLNTSADFKFVSLYPTSGAPDLTPGSGSPALSGVDFTGADFSNSFFVQTAYRGAIAPDSNWAAQSTWADWR
ncbi:MAG: hypothetical protein JSU01_16745 [Bacteroidetes bacterium]|nr:hypothetical protein [Bacteroidota bacterium]